MRAMHFVVLSVLACGAAVPLAQAQSVSVNATISGEVVPGVYGQVVHRQPATAAGGVRAAGDRASRRPWRSQRP